MRLQAGALGAGIFLGLAFLSVACWGASLIAALHAEKLSLVEIGTFGSMRSLDPLMPLFRTHELPDDAVLVGASSTGDSLLLLADSHRTAEGPSMPKIYDEVDVTTLERKVVSRFLPVIYRMLAFSAELSPDGQSIAFSGDFVTREGRGGYGLHLLKVSGEIRALVATTEPKTPQSIGWSKDGRTIVYHLDGHVLLCHLDNGASTFLTEGTRPVWSPDGARIAYRRPDNGAALIQPDGTGQRDILDKVQLGWGLRWSPDSRYLLYTDHTHGGIRVLGACPSNARRA